MKIEVGDIVKNEVDLSGIRKQDIAKKVGISRNWLKELLDSPTMEAKYLVSIGKAIRHDFSKNFPDLRTYITILTIEPEETIANLTNTELRARLLDLQDKYIVLLEKYSRVLEDPKAK